MSWSRVALLVSWTSFSASASFPVLPAHHHLALSGVAGDDTLALLYWIDLIIIIPYDRTVAEPSPVAEALGASRGHFHENLE